MIDHNSAAFERLTFQPLTPRFEPLYSRQSLETLERFCSNFEKSLQTFINDIEKSESKDLVIRDKSFIEDYNAAEDIMKALGHALDLRYGVFEVKAMTSGDKRRKDIPLSNAVGTVNCIRDILKHSGTRILAALHSVKMGHANYASLKNLRWLYDNYNKSTKITIENESAFFDEVAALLFRIAESSFNLTKAKGRMNKITETAYQDFVAYLGADLEDGDDFSPMINPTNYGNAIMLLVSYTDCASRTLTAGR